MKNSEFQSLSRKSFAIYMPFKAIEKQFDWEEKALKYISLLKELVVDCGGDIQQRVAQTKDIHFPGSGPTTG